MSKTCLAAFFGERFVIKANRKKEIVRDKTGFMVCLMSLNIVYEHKFATPVVTPLLNYQCFKSNIG